MRKQLIALLMVLLLLGTAAQAEVTPMVRNGGSFVFAVDVNGQIWGWGDNRKGQLGHPKSKLITSPTLVAEGIDGTALLDIQCGNENTLYLMQNGTVFTSGTGSHGTQGLGRNSGGVFAPQQIPELENIVSVSCGFGHNIALDRDGHVWSWGRNSGGQVGSGVREAGFRPIQLELENIVQATCGGKFSLALDKDGKLWGWGENTYGVLNPNLKNKAFWTPVEVEAVVGHTITAIAGGSDCAFLLDDQGQLWSWGRNDYWQLGNSQMTDKQSTELVLVDIPTRVTRVIGYSSHVMAIDEDRNAWIWGSVSASQLGNGESKVHKLPTCTWDCGDAIDGAIGSLICTILSKDGYVFVAGYNKYGQIGMNHPKSAAYWVTTGLNLLTGTIGEPFMMKDR